METTRGKEEQKAEEDRAGVTMTCLLLRQNALFLAAAMHSGLVPGRHHFGSV